MNDIVLHTEPDFDNNRMTFVPFCIRFMNNMHVYSGTGKPDSTLGVSGDYYLRNDTPNKSMQRIYIKNGSAWIGIV